MADKPSEGMETNEKSAEDPKPSDPAKGSSSNGTQEKAAGKNLETIKKNASGFSNVSPSYSQLQSGLQDIVKSYVASKSSTDKSSTPASNSKSEAAEKPKADENNSKRKERDEEESFAEVIEEENNYYADFLDRTKSDYYCKVCDSHMNSEQMWENHVQGKRHLKNIKKDPGEPPSKVKAVRTDLVPKIHRILDTVHEPVVGLDYMCELQRAESYLDPTYSCYLCHATCTVSTVVDHILGTKHRIAYLKEVNPDEHTLVGEMNLKKSGLTSIAEDYAREFERKRGRGKMEVKVEKPTMAPPASKRERRYMCDSDDDDDLMYRRRPRSPPMESDWRRERDRWSPTSSMMASQSMGMRSSYMGGAPNYAAMSMMEKISVLRQVGSNLIVVSESEGREVMQIINSLTQSLLQYKIRVLPHQLQETLARHIISGDVQGLESTLGLAGCGMSNVGSVINSMAASGNLPMRNANPPPAARLSVPVAPNLSAARMGFGNMGGSMNSDMRNPWGLPGPGQGRRSPPLRSVGYPSTSQWQGGMGGGPYQGSDRSSLGY